MFQGCGVGVGVGVSPPPRSLETYYSLIVAYIEPNTMMLVTIVYLLLEFRISIKSSLSTHSVCYTIGPKVGVGVQSKVLNFLTPKSESEFFFHKKTRTPLSWR